MADALSRREQDLPKGDDARFQDREAILIKPGQFTGKELPHGMVRAAPVRVQAMPA